jgi:hypothetical protein
LRDRSTYFAIRNWLAESKPTSSTNIALLTLLATALCHSIALVVWTDHLVSQFSENTAEIEQVSEWFTILVESLNGVIKWDNPSTNHLLVWIDRGKTDRSAK